MFGQENAETQQGENKMMTMRLIDNLWLPLAVVLLGCFAALACSIGATLKRAAEDIEHE